MWFDTTLHYGKILMIVFLDALDVLAEMADFLSISY